MPSPTPIFFAREAATASATISATGPSASGAVADPFQPATRSNGQSLIDTRAVPAGSQASYIGLVGSYPANAHSNC